MIIVNVKGGLGNQMFQYACGRAMALRNQDHLKLDNTGYRKRDGKDIHRAYRLGFFNTAGDIATDEEIRRLKYPFGLASKGWRFFRAKVLRAFNTGWNPRVLSWKGDIYLDGFWQSERFFKDHEDQIRKDFALKGPMSAVAKETHERIFRDPYAVSLHIRRGDYVKDPAAASVFGTCDMDYYERAVAAVSAQVPKPNLYVFSDDIEWAQDNLRLPFPTHFVSSPDIADYEELVLMSACRHNIIANSSFSWWGAWLNQNPGKMVFAPRRWSLIHEKKWYSDIIPESWQRL